MRHSEFTYSGCLLHGRPQCSCSRGGVQGDVHGCSIGCSEYLAPLAWSQLAPAMLHCSLSEAESESWCVAVVLAARCKHSIHLPLELSVCAVVSNRVLALRT